MIVIKRDGTEKAFNADKIKNAISKANSRTNEMTADDIERIVGIVLNKLPKLTDDKISVETIQDAVEDTLLKSRFNKTAKSYIIYRDERSRTRDLQSKLMRQIAKKLKADSVARQNANVDEASFGGRKGEADAELMKWLALNCGMSKMAKDNHLNNEIYIHDADSYIIGMHNCLSVPFDKLLAEGFNTRQTDVRPAGSISTAFQLVAVVFQLQSLQQFGGVSATHLDWTMVPYVRKSFRKHFLDGVEFCETDPDSAAVAMILDGYNKPENMSIEDAQYKDFKNAYKYALKMTTRELQQAVEGMYHNLNTLQSRSGNQLPFTSINYGTCTLPEGRMIIQALLEGSLKGVGKHHVTSIFPCGIFQYKKGVNDKPGTPNYDLFRLALKSTAKRLYPNYMLCDWSVDTTGNELDRQAKQRYLDSLTEEQMQELVDWCENNQELADKFGLKVVED